jgi:hypothetical protein
MEKEEVPFPITAFLGLSLDFRAQSFQFVTYIVYTTAKKLNNFSPQILTSNFRSGGPRHIDKPRSYTLY